MKSFKQFLIEKYQFLYHGTSDKYLSDIMKNGLKPNTETGNRTWDVSQEGKTYFSTEPRQAAVTARHSAANAGGKPILIKINRNHPSIKGAKIDMNDNRIMVSGNKAFTVPSIHPDAILGHYRVGPKINAMLRFKKKK